MWRGIEQAGNALKWVFSKLKADKAVLLEAVKQDMAGLRFASRLGGFKNYITGLFSNLQLNWGILASSHQCRLFAEV